MPLNQTQKLKLASFYHENAFQACIDETDYLKVKLLYEKVLSLNPNDEMAKFNLDIIKVIT
jgi:hypothetical protein